MLCTIAINTSNTIRTQTGAAERYSIHAVVGVQISTVHRNGQRLNHDPYPVYVVVTSVLTFSYRERLSRSAAKLNCRTT